MLSCTPRLAVQPAVDLVAVGAATDCSVRLWWRCERGGPFLLELRDEGEQAALPVARMDLLPEQSADHTFALTYPDEVPGAAVLRPLTAYSYRILSADGFLVGQGRFETAPAGPGATPRRFSLAAVSCHQPFDERGRVRPDALDMLRAVDRALREHDVKRVVLMGDQIYADAPLSRSLFRRAYFATVAPAGRAALLDCTEQEIRGLYQQRYRTFWALPEFQALQADYATSCVPDDHEVVDVWNSVGKHGRGPWQRAGRAALGAYHDYQGRRTFAADRPPSFHHSFHFGSLSVFVMDIRSQRRSGPAPGSPYGQDQFDDLRRFLAGADGAAVVVLVVSVPLLFIPCWLTALGVRLPRVGGSFADRWSAPAYRSSRDGLLRLLEEHRRAHPGQHLVLLSGDLHTGSAAVLRFPSCPDLPVYQFVSSALTNRDRHLEAVVAKRFIHLLRYTSDEIVKVQLLPGTPGGQNPCMGLNAGILEITRQGSGAELRWLLVGSDGTHGVPCIVYDSGPLATRTGPGRVEESSG